MLHDGRANRVAVIGGSRIPFCRSHSVYRKCSNQDLMAAALGGLINKYDLKGQTLGDVALGAVIKHSRDWNLARESLLDAGLSPQTPGVDLQRACGTSLEACAMIANKIALGQIDSGIAGGTDTISDAPIVYNDDYRSILLDVYAARSAMQRILPWFRLRPSHFKPAFPGVTEPRTGLSMGQSMEITAKQWEIPREHQDQLALASHVKAAAAYDAGWYEDMVVPFMDCEEDNNVRRDTTFEKLSALKPVFDKGEDATMTAGNSTPLTDGAAAVLLASEDWARLKNLPVSAYLTFVKVAAVNFVNDEGLLMAPAYAVSEMLKAANLRLQDFDFYEIHEAFAAQTIATLKAWQSEQFCRDRLGRNQAMGPIDLSKLNVKGGSLAIGHPFAATGARIVATMAKLLSENGSGRGLISVCTAGGMGVAAIMEAA
ncbi:MAG: acetyl-CoA C-acetyltransferase [Gammaproteobacteria bacterium]|nr:acetyl-CoA C-acetyltransferase [Gammaproteobacteria bacterium]MDH3428531.1 acetyl-CoA C-acetyltransferase [Gammaproteobacteria bacterium]MDH3435271.1 acetyl-CoA C-acetyltransferase [Gammaproteobacteria bacterium]